MDFKTINYEQGKIEYGSEEIYVSIITKFINMTFKKQVQELYLAVELLDQRRMEKACFVLKGSVGQAFLFEIVRQILAFNFLQKTNALYEIVKKQKVYTQREIIDLYHRYFDLIDESVLLALELSVVAQLFINITEFKSYSNYEFQSKRRLHLAKIYRIHQQIYKGMSQKKQQIIYLLIMQGMYNFLKKNEKIIIDQYDYFINYSSFKVFILILFEIFTFYLNLEYYLQQ
ncbi:unnamed protein product [Paramecium pentaurelia]|uniref:Transmembrane protein n=1 Tax=Paramecium pentaurelia TaxID=43138 RepID=A0A8S1SDQ4_9CILI|nr:unnamed protein product [Paramecium pentaurelia]